MRISDWSSDVCSSDLSSFPVALLVVCSFMPRRLERAGMRAALRATQIGLASHVPFFLSMTLLAPRLGGGPAVVIGIAGSLAVAPTIETGRASCWERVGS